MHLCVFMRVCMYIDYIHIYVAYINPDTAKH